MNVCILDIGSNTIRAVVYETIGERMVMLYNKGVASMIFAKTSGGSLSQEGQDELSETIKSLVETVRDYNCDYHAFATSAFRDLANKQEVIEYIAQKNGIRIKVLTGEEESKCDYLGLRRETGAVRGVGIDLGGGSCQMMSFSEEGLLSAVSYDMGSARIKRRFVGGVLPNKDEKDKIYDYVIRHIEGFDTAGARTLFAFGGTARAILMLKRVLHADRTPDRISREELEGFINFAYTAGAVPFLKAVTRKRFDTVIVGAIIISAIADYVGVDTVLVKDCSVRDGYVIKYVLENNY